MVLPGMPDDDPPDELPEDELPEDELSSPPVPVFMYSAILTTPPISLLIDTADSVVVSVISIGPSYFFDFVVGNVPSNCIKNIRPFCPGDCYGNLIGKATADRIKLRCRQITIRSSRSIVCNIIVRGDLAGVVSNACHGYGYRPSLTNSSLENATCKLSLPSEVIESTHPLSTSG